MLRLVPISLLVQTLTLPIAVAQSPGPSVGHVLISGSVERRDEAPYVNGRVITALPDVPLALGAGVVIGEDIRQFSPGVAIGLGDDVIFSLLGQFSSETSASALGVISTERLGTNSVSSKLVYALPGQDDRFAVFASLDAWNAPGGAVLRSDLLSTTSFSGASGYRIAPGFRLNGGGFSIVASLGYENGTLNGDTGLYAKADLSTRLESFNLGLSAWTSPNFGSGARLSIGREFGNGVQAVAFAGYEKARRDGATFGVKLSFALDPQPKREQERLVAALDQHFDHANLTLFGMPVTARQHGVTVQANLPPAPVYTTYQDVFGNICNIAVVAPGCTFLRADGTRMTVMSDPDYNKQGNGTDDLWYVKFAQAGQAVVYNDLGQFQYFAQASDFAGYIGGTTIGVGTSWLYWEDVASRTYWLGASGVLYSANSVNGNFGQAIN